LTAFLETLFFPAAVLGPVERCAFFRFDSIFLKETFDSSIGARSIADSNIAAVPQTWLEAGFPFLVGISG
jgi:hypothetical protein